MREGPGQTLGRALRCVQPACPRASGLEVKTHPLRHICFKATSCRWRGETRLLSFEHSVWGITGSLCGLGLSGGPATAAGCSRGCSEHPGSKSDLLGPLHVAAARHSTRLTALGHSGGDWWHAGRHSDLATYGCGCQRRSRPLPPWQLPASSLSTCLLLFLPKHPRTSKDSFGQNSDESRSQSLDGMRGVLKR